MGKKTTSRRTRRRSGRGLLLLTALAACVLAIGSPAQATTHVGVFGGFGGTFPGSYLNGGTLHTVDSVNAFHVWSSAVVFDVDSGSIGGGGPFSMVTGGVPGGGTVFHGSWKAKRLLAWKSIGLCRDVPFCLTGGPFAMPFPNGFNAGKMRAIITLFDGSGKEVGRAVLTIWCSLPGIPYGVDRRDPDRRGIEQYRVRIITGKFKGLDFKVGRSGTVFIDLSVP